MENFVGCEKKVCGTRACIIRSLLVGYGICFRNIPALLGIIKTNRNSRGVSGAVSESKNWL